MTRLLTYCSEHFTIHDVDECTSKTPQTVQTALESTNLSDALKECKQAGFKAYVQRNAKHVMRTYGRFISQLKAKNIRDSLSQGSEPNKKAHRGLIYYRAYLKAYLKAKQAVLNGEDKVNA